MTIWEKSRIALPFTFKNNRGRKSQEQTESSIEGTKFCGVSVKVGRAPDLILGEQEVLPGGGNDQDKSVKEVVQVSVKVQSWTNTINAHSDRVRLPSQSLRCIILLSLAEDCNSV